MTTDEPSSKIDSTAAHMARRYNYWLGGKDNFAADRESGDAIAAIFPGIVTAAVENRRFLQRAVRFLAEQCGIRQFLDIGTGLPATDNTHEVAQAIAPGSRIVYVDNDPLVLVHARALLTSSPEGRTAYIDADVRDPQTILADDTLKATLDLSQPVAVLLVAVLHFVPDDDQAYAAVRALMDAMSAGSYLVVSHASGDLLEPDRVAALARDGYVGSGDTTLRGQAQVARFFDGLDMVPPGLQVVSEWRLDPDSDAYRPRAEQVSVYGGLAQKS